MSPDLIFRQYCGAPSWTSVAACVTVIAATACSGSPTGITCTEVFVPGIVIDVRNASTHAALTDSAVVKVTDGSHVETYLYLGPPGQPYSGTIDAAGERAGTYSISIRKTGFAPYDTASVHVTRDVCHVRQVNVIANMQPVAGG